MRADHVPMGSPRVPVCAHATIASIRRSPKHDHAEFLMQFAGAVLQGRHPNTTIGLNSMLSSVVDGICLVMLD